ncbi:MAG: hypothetical protein KDB14_33160, partial [Planctomycetales bacterium]|nr:hypothetical protein [Planctomycetales bacterium]
MSAKDEILRRLRSTEAPSAPLPDLDDAWTRYDDIDGRFASLVAAVGGVCHQVASWDEARQVIEALPPVQNAGGLESP